MEIVMPFDKDPEFYRGYVPEHKSVLPMAVTLGTIIAMWMLVYLIATIGPAPQPVEPYSGMLTSHFAKAATQR